MNTYELQIMLYNPNDEEIQYQTYGRPFYLDALTEFELRRGSLIIDGIISHLDNNGSIGIGPMYEYNSSSWIIAQVTLDPGGNGRFPPLTNPFTSHGYIKVTKLDPLTAFTVQGRVIEL